MSTGMIVDPRRWCPSSIVFRGLDCAVRLVGCARFLNISIVVIPDSRSSKLRSVDET